MNAHVKPATGRAPLDTDVLVLQQADVILFLADAKGTSSLSAIAKATGKDPSNLRKSLTRLLAEKLVRQDGGPDWRLTKAGREWLPRIAAFRGEAPIGGGTLPPLRHSQISVDPDNPRKLDRKDPAEIAETKALAENIARHDVLVPLRVILDDDPTTGGMLEDGERRHWAIGMLIEAADPRWPADKPVPYVAAERQTSDVHLARAIITSIHKKALHPLEEANALAELKHVHGWTPARILEETGFERKVYEQRLDLLNLTAAQQARMRLDPDDDNYLTVKGARLLVSHLRTIANPKDGAQLDIEGQTLDLTDKLQLPLIELAFAIEQKSDRSAVQLTSRPTGGGLATLADRALIIIASNPGGDRVTAAIPKAGAAMAWLNAKGFYDEPTKHLEVVRLKVLGPAREAYLHTQRVYATDELNTDPCVVQGVRCPNITIANERRRSLGLLPRQSNSGGGTKAKVDDRPTDEQMLFLAEIAHATATRPSSTGSARVDLVRGLDEKLLNWLVISGTGFTVSTQDSYSGCLSEKGQQVLQEAKRWPVDDGCLRMMRFAAGLPAHAIKALEEIPRYHHDCLNAPRSPAQPAEKPDAFNVELTRRERLIMLEVAHARHQRPGPKPHLNSTTVGSYWLDDAKKRLVDPPIQFIRFMNPTPGEPWLVQLTGAGLAWLSRDGDIGGATIPTDEQLLAAQNAVVKAGWDGVAYVTRWLNDVPSKADAEAGSEPEDAGEDEPDEQDVVEAKAAEVLSQVDVEISSAWGFIDTDRAEWMGCPQEAETLLALAGLKGPFVAGEDGGIAGPNPGDDYAQVDCNGELPDAMAHARAKLIAFALNVICGHRQKA